MGNREDGIGKSEFLSLRESADPKRRWSAPPRLLLTAYCLVLTAYSLFPVPSSLFPILAAWYILSLPASGAFPFVFLDIPGLFREF